MPCWFSVWEPAAWTGSPWSPTHEDTGTSPAPSCCAPQPPLTEQDRRVTRGGSHLCAPSYCHRYRPAARQAHAIRSTTSHLGFRCCDPPDQLSRGWSPWPGEVLAGTSPYAHRRSQDLSAKPNQPRRPRRGQWGAGMATIDRHRQRRQVDTAAMMVLQTHRAVCAVRSSRSHHHRHPCVHHSRRTRRPQMSQYRTAMVIRADIPTAATQSGRSRRDGRRLLAVLAITTGLGLTCLILLRALVPATAGRPAVLVVCLMAITAAVVLNAITIDSTGRSERAPPGTARGESSGSLDALIHPRGAALGVRSKTVADRIISCAGMVSHPSGLVGARCPRLPSSGTSRCSTTTRVSPAITRTDRGPDADPRRRLLVRA